MSELCTDRAALNADPDVREYFPDVLTREQWALEVRATGEFIGFAGLDPVEDDRPFTGVEAGWRLARSAWGHGYATEAAQAGVSFGFERLGLAEVLAVTTASNLRSQPVMRRIGMTRDPADDFDDPSAPEGPLRPNVVYRLRVEEWRTVPRFSVWLREILPSLGDAEYAAKYFARLHELAVLAAELDASRSE